MAPDTAPDLVGDPRQADGRRDVRDPIDGGPCRILPLIQPSFALISELLIY